MNNKSPYLSKTNRLSDVISAIQVMGTYKFYKLDFAAWADRITGDINQADYWKKIFIEHPEFFRLDTQKQKASLVWRRQFPKRYDVDRNVEISREEYYSLSADQKLRISRNTLKSENIQALISSAIELHSRALEHQKDKRWWIPLVFSLLGGLAGAIIGSLFKS